MYHKYLDRVIQYNYFNKPLLTAPLRIIFTKRGYTHYLIIIIITMKCFILCKIMRSDTAHRLDHKTSTYVIPVRFCLHSNSRCLMMLQRHVGKLVHRGHCEDNGVFNFFSSAFISQSIQREKDMLYVYGLLTTGKYTGKIQ